MRFSRRTFLKIGGAAAAGAALWKGTRWVAPSLTALAKVPEAELPPITGVPRWVNTVCLQCDAACGIRVKVVDGRAIKVEGNPDFPTNKGGVCPKGQSALQELYDPDRIKGPLQRTGPRGSGRWRRIPWPQALSEVAQRLRELREGGEPHTLVVMGGRYRGLMEPLFSRLLETYGSPNHIAEPNPGAEALLNAYYLSQGVKDFPGFDLAQVNYLLSFGYALLEAGRPTVPNLQRYAEMRQGRPGHRSKMVQVEPRLSITAAKADEWLPILPGTDGALALGIAHVIVQEGLYDRDFIARNAFGFENWTDERGDRHEGFKSLVLRDYPPERVAEITGIEVERIVRIAGEFAAHRPALAIAGRGVGSHTNGLYSAWAVHCLNALVGSFGIPGGLQPRTYPPFNNLPKVEKDAIAERGLAMPRIDGAGALPFPLSSSLSQALPEAVLEGKPYPVKAIRLYYTNPVYSRPQGSRFEEALRKVPLVVSLSPFWDESAQMADYILPDNTFLERLQDDLILSPEGFPIVGVRQPVVEPLYDTASTGDVLISLAQEIGGGVGAAFPWHSYEELLLGAVASLHDPPGGSIQGGSLYEFWGKVKEAAGWWDTSQNGKGKLFSTPSGKFEFYSLTLKEKLGASPSQLKLQARGDALFMPHFEPPRFAGEEKDYPLYLNTYKTMTLAQGRGANQPFLLEVFGAHIRQGWQPWVEINPRTAAKLGIGDKDMVWVESPLGRIKVMARLYEGAMPQVVNMPIGFGHKGYGRWADGRGENPNSILGRELEALCGGLALGATRVKVYKA